MGLTKVYLLTLYILVVVHFCAGATTRLKRSNGKEDLDLDENGWCKTAQYWKSDCNTCWCPEKGAPACTLIGCSDAVPPPVTVIVHLDTVKNKDSSE